MSNHSMTPAEIEHFLRAEPPLVAAVSTVRPDGSPHVAPVWVAFDDDGHIYFNTGADTVKGRNLAATGRVALSFHDHRPPFSFVVVTGTVELIDDLEQVGSWAERIGGRYMGADRAVEYGRRNGVSGELLVRVTPVRTTAMKDLAD